MNKNSGHIDEKLLLRFLLGQATADELHLVNNWLEQSASNKKLLDQYESVWVEAGKLIPNPVAVDTKRAWQKMSSRVDEYELEKLKEKSKTVSLTSRPLWLGISAAAAIVILFGVYQLFLRTEKTGTINQIASFNEIVYDSLPDGSKITLNANSEISYPEKFAQNERRVKLKGEAFFKVNPDKEKPFIIETENAFVQVLGTSFNVKTLENKDVVVIVTEGLVKLYTINKETSDTLAILLKAGQKGTLSALNKTPEHVSENIPDELFWMDYTLIFNDTDLQKVFDLLENYYNITIKVSDKKIYDCRLTTTFSKSSIEDVLDVIVATFDFKYTKENNTYTIEGNGCADKNI